MIVLLLTTYARTITSSPRSPINHHTSEAYDSAAVALNKPSGRNNSVLAYTGTFIVCWCLDFGPEKIREGKAQEHQLIKSRDTWNANHDAAVAELLEAGGITYLHNLLLLDMFVWLSSGPGIQKAKESSSASL